VVLLSIFSLLSYTTSCCPYALKYMFKKAAGLNQNRLF
jgi:hypothetical protein